MRCPQCHTESRANAKYCDECGYELPTVAPLARDMFGYGDDDLDGADTFDLSGDTARLASADLPFAGLDQINDSSYSPASAPVLAGTQAASDITRPFGTPAGVYAGTPHVASGPEGPNLDWARRSFSTDAPQPSEQPPAKARHVARNVAIVALCLIALATAAVGVTYSLEMWGGHVIEDVTGMDANQATVLLSEEGFLVERTLVKSDEVEDVVLSTDPQPGTRMAEGSTITLSVSTPRIVPNIVGKPLDEAKSMIAAEEFANVEVVEKKSNDAEGTVLSVSPTAGTRAKADAKITVEAAVPYRVPSVVGLTQDEAVAMLQLEGYSSKVASVYDEGVEEGRVVGTEPAAGSALASGSEVVVNVAKHRSTELIALTRSWLKDSSRINIAGTNYELGEVVDVSYKGENACAYTISARPYETHSWFGVESETRYGNYERISGTITWGSDDKVASTNPEIKRL